MTRNDIINFGMKKYGKNWIGPLAEEIKYSFSQLWRVSEGEAPVTRRLELEIERVIRQQRFETLGKPDVRYE